MKTPRPSRRRANAGAAMIEVLVSLLLFSLGILGLVGLQVRAIGFSVDAEDRNRAAMLANEIASQMILNKSLAAVDAADGSAWQARVGKAQADGLLDGKLEITVNGNRANIRITWHATARGTETSELLTTVVLP